MLSLAVPAFSPQEIWSSGMISRKRIESWMRVLSFYRHTPMTWPLMLLSYYVGSEPQQFVNILRLNGLKRPTIQRN